MQDFTNTTPLVAAYTQGMDAHGQLSIVVVAKGTYTLPTAVGESPVLHKTQQPLQEADTFEGDPESSAPIIESDYSPYKPRCDVLLSGHAYAPEGQAADRVAVRLQVAEVDKSLCVTGNRHWHKGKPSPIEPFTRLPIHYGRAYGGSRPLPQKPNAEGPVLQDCYLANPVGIGYYPNCNKPALEGLPLPNIEALDRFVRRPVEKEFPPLAFGPLGRAWLPRVNYAGTYDAQWQQQKFLFLPDDFDERFYQTAPSDQQTAYLQGGELVTLTNLTPQGRTHFHLPTLTVPVTFFYDQVNHTTLEMVIDTLHLFPSEGYFTLSWRARLPLQADFFELQEVYVGQQSRAWWRARKLGKTYYKSLSEIATKRALTLNEKETE